MTQAGKDLVKDADTSTQRSTLGISTGTHTTNWSGIWATSQSGNLSWQKVINEVSLFLPAVIATATIGSFISIDTLLPASLWPTTEERDEIIIQNAGYKSGGEVVISSTGSVKIYAYIEEGNFSGSGSAGFPKMTVRYNLS